MVSNKIFGYGPSSLVKDQLLEGEVGHEDYREELILFVFCQPITDVYCGHLTNESARFL